MYLSYLSGKFRSIVLYMYIFELTFEKHEILEAKNPLRYKRKLEKNKFKLWIKTLVSQ